METVTRVRIEVLADAPLVSRVVAALHKAEVHGHTILPVLSGSGRGGSWSEERLTDAESKRLIVAIGSREHAASFVDAVGPLLESHGMLLTLSDVQVVRGDRF